MFENIIGFFKKILKKEKEEENNKDMAKERLHLVLMQDRANVSADFLEMMKQEIIDVIKKYIDVDESEIDVHLTNKTSEDGTSIAPALYANIPIVSIKHTGEIDEEIREKVQNQELEEQKNKTEKEEIKPENNNEEKLDNNSGIGEEIPKEDILTKNKINEEESDNINKEIEDYTENNKEISEGNVESKNEIILEDIEELSETEDIAEVEENSNIENTEEAKEINKSDEQIKKENLIHNNRKRRNKKRKGKNK